MLQYLTLQTFSPAIWLPILLCRVDPLLCLVGSPPCPGPRRAAVRGRIPDLSFLLHRPRLIAIPSADASSPIRTPSSCPPALLSTHPTLSTARTAFSDAYTTLYLCTLSPARTLYFTLISFHVRRCTLTEVLPSHQNRECPQHAPSVFLTHLSGLFLLCYIRLEQSYLSPTVVL